MVRLLATGDTYLTSRINLHALPRLNAPGCIRFSRYLIERCLPVNSLLDMHSPECFVILKLLRKIVFFRKQNKVVVLLEVWTEG